MRMEGANIGNKWLDLLPLEYLGHHSSLLANMPQTSKTCYIVVKMSHTNKILHQHNNSQENLLAHNNMGQHLLTHYFLISHMHSTINTFLTKSRTVHHL